GGDIAVRVVDATTDSLTPCRITVLKDEQLMTVGASSTATMAVRPGVIYCLGAADFTLPPGHYRLIAGRGPEYGITVAQLQVEQQSKSNVDLMITREVDTTGWVSCDTHVHTLTHSGHGDASIEERMLTLAGECVEFPIATDHNRHIDYSELAAQLGVGRYFTPVIGNEVTTKVGHFNVFPIASADTPLPDHTGTDWTQIFTRIGSTPDVKAIILNHARDIHSNYRPFGPQNHLALTAENLDGWQLEANAMEIINSGAQQTEMMQLPLDWMSQLNAGRRITPVGCSDSHDVARHFVGQARTYLQCDDTDVSQISRERAIQSFVEGRVSVSCGLFCRILVNDQFGPGDLVSTDAPPMVRVEVAGPAWAQADEVELFLNGESILMETIPETAGSLPGVKHTMTCQLPTTLKHDAFLVAVARGPGVRGLHWPIARPYQPTSTEWIPLNMAITGAVQLDLDEDGKMTSAREYAQQVCRNADNNFVMMCAALETFDTAVALHAASIWFRGHTPELNEQQASRLRDAPEFVRDAFERYRTAWRDSQILRAER
ncbi:MAG: CehA/McbA family metallohydrolase, partial [Planctomycetaceae bacterium]|nr:CehA/McbA family metallohydrolase [Planctomycetaceae bacterium]